jgi:hypothetical protein
METRLPDVVLSCAPDKRFLFFLAKGNDLLDSAVRCECGRECGSFSITVL